MIKKLLLLLGTVILLASCQPTGRETGDITPQVDEQLVTEPVGDVTPDAKPASTATSMEPTRTAEPSPEPTVATMPMPQHIRVVIPVPGGSYTMTEYENLASSLGWRVTAPSICMSIWPAESLLEPGDFLTPEQFLSRIHLVVDNQTITEYHSLLMTDSEGGEKYDSETGELLWKEPDGRPYLICYAASLGVGRHSVTFVAKKTSGVDEAYTWEFDIIE